MLLPNFLICPSSPGSVFQPLIVTISLPFTCECTFTRLASVLLSLMTHPPVHDVIHDGVLYARSVWRGRLWGTPLYTAKLISEEQQYELRHLAKVMADAMDRQCAWYAIPPSQADSMLVRVQDHSHSSRESTVWTPSNYYLLQLY